MGRRKGLLKNATLDHQGLGNVLFNIVRHMTRAQATMDDIKPCPCWKVWKSGQPLDVLKHLYHLGYIFSNGCGERPMCLQTATLSTDMLCICGIWKDPGNSC